MVFLRRPTASYQAQRLPKWVAFDASKRPRCPCLNHTQCQSKCRFRASPWFRHPAAPKLAKYCPPHSCHWRKPPPQCRAVCSTTKRYRPTKAQRWTHCQMRPLANHAPKQKAKYWAINRPTQNHCPRPWHQSTAPHEHPTDQPTCPWPNRRRQNPTS